MNNWTNYITDPFFSRLIQEILNSNQNKESDYFYNYSILYFLQHDDYRI